MTLSYLGIGIGQQLLNAGDIRGNELFIIAGIIFAKVRDNFNNIYILTHIKGVSGLLMANDLGRKLFSAIQWLVPYALQIALFPFLCELVDKNDREQLGTVLSTSCRLLVSVFIPGSIILAVLAKPVSAFIFLGGKADVQVVLWAGMATACYILVLPAASMECVLMQEVLPDGARSLQHKPVAR